MQVVTIPGGKEKGTPVTAASNSTLEWWGENAKEQDLRDACSAELDRRAKGGKQQAPAPNGTNGAAPPRAQAPQGFDGLTFKSDDPASLTAWFHENRDKFNIITPATMVQSLPEGFEVAISLVYVNPHIDKSVKTDNKSNGEVYEAEGGGLCPSASTLSKISAAAGITWDPRACGQIDDGSHPHFVKYQVVAGWLSFDNSPIVEPATKTLDLRDGSARIEEKSVKWIRAQRENIHENAETKAKSRAIRRLGLRPSYTAKELEKPFAVARLMFTGRSKDPELARAFAMLKAQQATGGIRALFGQHADSPLGLPAPALRVQQLTRKPPELLAATDDDEDSRPGSYVPVSQPTTQNEPAKSDTSAGAPSDERQPELPGTGKY